MCECEHRSTGTDTLNLSLLGAFYLTYSGTHVPVAVSAQRVLAFLALQRRWISRTYVAGILWPDTTQRQAAASLRSALWRLRRTDLPLVRTTPSRIAMASGVRTDVHHVTARIRRLLNPARTLDPVELDPEALSSELLPDWTSEEWLVVERERFRQLRLHGLEAVSMILHASGRIGEAIEASVLAVHQEPLRESAHRTLIALHLAEGNRDEALRQYHWYERLLREELNIRPSQQMIQQIRGLQDDSNAATTAA